MDVDRRTTRLSKPIFVWFSFSVGFSFFVGFGYTIGLGKRHKVCFSKRYGFGNSKRIGFGNKVCFSKRYGKLLAFDYGICLDISNAIVIRKPYKVCFSKLNRFGFAILVKVAKPVSYSKCFGFIVRKRNQVCKPVSNAIFNSKRIGFGNKVCFSKRYRIGYEISQSKLNKERQPVIIGERDSIIFAISIKFAVSQRFAFSKRFGFGIAISFRKRYEVSFSVIVRFGFSKPFWFAFSKRFRKRYEVSQPVIIGERFAFAFNKPIRIS